MFEHKDTVNDSTACQKPDSPSRPVDADVSKPPLGIKPKVLWQEERMQELARAIYEYTMAGYYDRLTVGLWCEELKIMLDKEY
jgi:hypothetical protein